jgi:hypothetical protein
MRSDFEESLSPFFKAMDQSTRALENVPKSAKVHLSVIGPDIDLSDSEICTVDANIKEDAPRTPQSRLLQEFAQARVVGTLGIGIYCSMQEGCDAPRFRNLLPKKVFVSSGAQVAAIQLKEKPSVNPVEVERGNGSDCQDGRCP